jgi:hypothetical protein
MPNEKENKATPDHPARTGRDAGDSPKVPPVEQPDPRSPQFKREVREEIEKEKLDP